MWGIQPTSETPIRHCNYLWMVWVKAKNLPYIQKP